MGELKMIPPTICPKCKQELDVFERVKHKDSYWHRECAEDDKIIDGFIKHAEKLDW